MTSPLNRILVLAAIWGCSFLFIKESLAGVSDTQVALTRIVLGAATLLLIAWLRHEPLPRRVGTWAHLAFMGVVGNVLPFLGFAWGEAHGAPSGLAGIYNATTPLWTLLIAIAVLPAERPTRARVVGLVLGFGGVLVVLAPWRTQPGVHLSGQLACLGAGASYGVSFAWTRRFIVRSGSPIGLAAAQLVCATVEIGVVAPLIATQHVVLHPKVWLSLLALGVVGTGLAYVLNYGIIRDVGATTAASVTYLIPLVAVVLGVIVLGETLRWNDFAGALVVIAGIAVAEGRLRWRTLPSQARGSSEAPG